MKLSKKQTIISPTFGQWRRVDQLRMAVYALFGIIGVLVLVMLLLWVGWLRAPQKLRLYIPPNIDQGVTLQADHIPTSTVYAFAYQIFTAINTWMQSGDVDYVKNINAYKNYLSPQFYRALLLDAHTREINGALSRERMLSGAGAYSISDVHYLGNGTWHVQMRLHLVETVTGNVIKDVVMTYPITVERVRAAIAVNPWGLVLGGFYHTPTRYMTRDNQLPITSRGGLSL